MKKTIIALSVLTVLSFSVFADEHYKNMPTFADGYDKQDPTPGFTAKPASEHTVRANRETAKRLPYSDKIAFEEQARGLIAAFGDNKAGQIREPFHAFLKDVDPKDHPDSVNPSIFRQAVMNYQAQGLYKVVDGVYQLRGHEISNVTFFRTKTGYVVNDQGLLDETMRLGWEFAKKHLPAPHTIHAVVYSHAHGDHFGGVRGLSEDFADDVKVIAPDGFVEAVSAENMIAGNAMSRRADYQYGSNLPKNIFGQVDNAIGLAHSHEGDMTLITPNVLIVDKVEKHTIDGVEFEFTNVPEAEAPVEIITWVEQYKTLFTGELTFHGMHNIYTFRGAKTRDALNWTKYLTEMKLAYGDRIQALTSSHSAPVWGTDTINEYLTYMRDNYGFIHNQSMRLANNGATINDIGRKVEAIVPEALFNKWYNNGYHGSYVHNARGVVNLYLGYYDANPVNINPLLTQDKSCIYVNAVGAETLYKAGMKHFDKGEYQESSQLFNDLVQCEPTNIKYRDALADSFEQQGYQSETMAWRNAYLQGANELRTSQTKPPIKFNSSDVIASSPTEGIFDMMAVRLNAPKAVAAGLNLSFNTVHKDVKQYFYTEISNGNMVTVETEQPVKNAGSTLYITKMDLSDVLVGRVTAAELFKSGKASIQGNQNLLQEILANLDDFNPTFDILPLLKK
ncbi:MAG: MBL fold metallo-hydrolase [Deltaproteobacteria bacterium]|nr:MBL fold metallo-hydrolase [Deltaproteobacteria bacterium]MBW2226933.1 MBL fold metallo-hydrolase [Deltaproteobacteria bacterium]MBW2326174.1 MBL fold metallo-hydrolase [Deltaproteobacteria bacterium]MBW2555616.1 MBL fold metallo-hydrolase [Deltaproteobacteria bacterium]